MMAQKVALVFLALTFATSSASSAVARAMANPIEKVIEMMSDLEQKIIGEGQAAQGVYDEFAEWCEEQSKELGFTIKTGKASSEELNSIIEKAVADIAEFDEKIGGLTGTISTDESDLKAATAIRGKEHGIFVTEEGELMDTVDTIERAVGIIAREMAKNPGAAFVQMQTAGNHLADALRLIVDSVAISTGDKSRLTALLQNKNRDTTLEEDHDAEAVGAPDPAAYKSKSGGIVDVLNDLLTDAQTQLDEARKVEKDSQFNFDVLKVELADAIKFGKKELAKTEKKKNESNEAKSVTEGELSVVTKQLNEDLTQRADTHHDCMTKAQDFETETMERGEELKAIATAKKIVQETTGGAGGQSYSLAQEDGDASFLQVSMKSRALEANFQAVRRIENLAHQLHSTVLAQLAQRMDAAARLSGKTGDDPFAKIKGLISEMIEKLLKEAEEEAAKKGYCDKEMGETKAKKEELNGEIDELTVKIDKMTADSAMLKEEVAILSKELAELSKLQQEMDKIREEENTAYKKNRAEMEQGVEGIKLALKVLREYYGGGAFIEEGAGQKKADGAGGGIISMLEVIEADFEKGLAEIITAEESAAEEYEKITKENEIAKVTKEQDVKYKGKEAKGLDESVAEHTSDKTGLQTELASVLEYWKSLEEECLDKVEPYEERKKRREAEIAGLKDALAILSGEAVLLQKASSHTKLRGIGRH